MKNKYIQLTADIDVYDVDVEVSTSDLINQMIRWDLAEVMALRNEIDEIIASKEAGMRSVESLSDELVRNTLMSMVPRLTLQKAEELARAV